MLRLFVGIGLPPEHRLALSVICLGLHGARWVDPGNYHVTVRFIGEVDEGTASDVDAALTGVRSPAFPLSVEAVDVFGSDKPRTLYAGVGKSPPLALLHERVEHALMRAGLEPKAGATPRMSRWPGCTAQIPKRSADLSQPTASCGWRRFRLTAWSWWRAILPKAGRSTRMWQNILSAERVHGAKSGFHE